MSVRYGLTIEISGLRIVYVPYWHVPLMMQSRAMAILRLRSRRTEVYARTSPEIWTTVNYSQKDKIMPKEDNLHVSTQAI